jgi:hypothetical protein
MWCDMTSSNYNGLQEAAASPRAMDATWISDMDALTEGSESLASGPVMSHVGATSDQPRVAGPPPLAITE